MLASIEPVKAEAQASTAIIASVVRKVTRAALFTGIHGYQLVPCGHPGAALLLAAARVSR